MEVACPKCSQPVEPGQTVCRHCGAALHLDVQAGQNPGATRQAQSALPNAGVPSINGQANWSAEQIFGAAAGIVEALERQSVFDRLGEALQEAPYVSALYTRANGHLELTALHAPQDGRAAAGDAVLRDRVRIPLAAVESVLPQDSRPKIFDLHADTNAGVRLFEELRQTACRSVALLPMRPAGELQAVVLIATTRSQPISLAEVEPFSQLAAITSAALAKIRVIGRLEKRVSVLQTIHATSQAVSQETSLDKLYRLIHIQVEKVMGKVDFLIALYNQENNSIEIPYAQEGEQFLSLPSFPLGQGLTSILIQSQQPLLLVEDTERKAKELGAKVSGGTAKSWLGVPLSVGGEPIGALIVQDLEQEGRFDHEDQQLLSTLAAQISIAVRNARLIAASQLQAERQRQRYQITRKIRSSTDLRRILQLTASELGKAIGAQRVSIELGVSAEEKQASQVAAKPAGDEGTA